MPDDPVQAVPLGLRLNQTFFMRNSFNIQLHNALYSPSLLSKHFHFF